MFFYFKLIFSSVQSLSHVRLCDPMNCSTPGLPVHHQLLEFTQTHVHRVGDTIQPSHPLSFPSPPAPNPSQHQRLSIESTLGMRWPKYWSFSFSIIPSKEHPGLISIRMDFIHSSVYIPGLGRSPGEGKGYPLQYSGLENFRDCIVHGVTKSRTRLSNFHFQCVCQSQSPNSSHPCPSCFFPYV